VSDGAGHPGAGWGNLGVALLGADLDHAQGFVADELTGLAKDDPYSADLRRTLLSYLDMGSLVAAAGEMHVYRNTVVYRLKRAEQILGRPVSAHSHELHAPLRPASRLGVLTR
jgi:DNA-binding PucR family transcriptional regulator